MESIGHATVLLSDRHTEDASATPEMTKAIFTTKISPVYDDLPEERYHFPRTYLNQARAAVGDWIVYYEPRRATGDLTSSGGRMVYFATARVDRIVPDPVLADHFYAEVSNYLQFVNPVPFRSGTHYYERMLEKADGTTNKGAFGRAVRTLSDAEYDLIWMEGFGQVIEPEARPTRERDSPQAPEHVGALAEDGSPIIDDLALEQDRRIVEQLVSRPFRDRAFSAAVKTAYDNTCAMTGLRIINGGGRSEVQAAHIRPVQRRGTDSVRNGIALSGTFHWIFDRGLVSIDDDYSLLLAKDRLPDTIGRLMGDNKLLRVPDRPELRPHPQFLDYHRRNIFKG